MSTDLLGPLKKIKTYRDRDRDRDRERDRGRDRGSTWVRHETEVEKKSFQSRSKDVINMEIRSQVFWIFDSPSSNTLS